MSSQQPLSTVQQENNPFLIEVLVTVRIERWCHTRHSEAIFEQEALDAVRKAVLKDQTLNVEKIELFAFEHCEGLMRSLFRDLCERRCEGKPTCYDSSDYA